MPVIVVAPEPARVEFRGERVPEDAASRNRGNVLNVADGGVVPEQAVCLIPDLLGKLAVASQSLSDFCCPVLGAALHSLERTIYWAESPLVCKCIYFRPLASKPQGKSAHGGVSCSRNRTAFRPPSVLIRRVLIACLLWLPELAFAELRPVESTLAHELLQLERQFRAVPDEATVRLDRIISDATDAADAVNPDPRTMEEALSVFGAIQVVTAKHNLV